MYLQGIKTLPLQMRQAIVVHESAIIGYSDTDFAVDKADRKSITGGWVTVDGMLVTWPAKNKVMGCCLQMRKNLLRLQWW